MTVGTVEPPADQQASSDAAPASSTPSAPALGAVLRWRDLVTPIVVVLVVGAEILYLRSRDLDAIEQNLLEPSRVVSDTVDHARLSAIIALIVIAIAVPLGVLVTRRSTAFLAPVILAVANIGQAAPVVGLIALIGIYWTIGFWPVVSILTAYAGLAVLRNTIVGLQGVDVGVLDAARGMGVSTAGRLLKIELPLAIPVIGAGARTAVVLAVATVPFGQFLDGGGLGAILFGAIKNDRIVALFAVSLFIAMLALLLDWVAGILQRALTPRGLR